MIQYLLGNPVFQRLIRQIATQEKGNDANFTLPKTIISARKKTHIPMCFTLVFMEIKINKSVGHFSIFKMAEFTTSKELIWDGSDWTQVGQEMFLYFMNNIVPHYIHNNSIFSVLVYYWVRSYMHDDILLRLGLAKLHH